VRHEFDILIDLLCIIFAIIIIVILIAWFRTANKICPTDDFFTELGNMFGIHIKLYLLSVSLK